VSGGDPAAAAALILPAAVAVAALPLRPQILTPNILTVLRVWISVVVDHSIIAN